MHLFFDTGGSVAGQPSCFTFLDVAEGLARAPVAQRHKEREALGIQRDDSAGPSPGTSLISMIRTIPGSSPSPVRRAEALEAASA
ncbi:MAG TPA: hypothetical protein VJS63_16245 [Bradyrhizobium sp.]|nr:hypothetical protein [Bradyrhizobium sp.]